MDNIKPNKMNLYTTNIESGKKALCLNADDILLLISLPISIIILLGINLILSLIIIG
jgi:hypothetical protein